jgi:cystathionine beta-lyase
MSTYSFDEPINRKGTDCVKVDALGPWFGNPELMPFWVADMDFASPPFIVEAINRRANHPVYGYPFRPERLNQHIINWLYKRHGWKIQASQICFSPGVVPGLSFAVQCFTSPGDSIIVQPPVYFPFFEIVEKNGRKLVYNPLKLIDSRLEMDFEDMEEKLKAGAKMLIISSPHNPGGTVWRRNELEKLAELCVHYKCMILSDEIHCDLVFAPHKHIPLASISKDIADQTISFIAPSKTFNVSGLSTAFVIISNEVNRKKYNEALETMHLMIGNIFGHVAAEAAYSLGHEWLDDLMNYLKLNVERIMEFFSTEFPLIVALRPESTFLIWLDCRKLQYSDEELQHFFRENAGIALNDGIMFGLGGSGFMRLNFGCPLSVLNEGLEKLKYAGIDRGLI